VTATRRPLIAGNWKLNHGPTGARSFLRGFLERCSGRADRDIVIFPPSLSLAVVSEALASRPDIQVGVQNVYWEESGAFTGENSALMAADAGARFALVGHSERRHLFGETDQETARKVRASLAAGLSTVLCLGETLEERESGLARQVVARQVDAVALAISSGHLSRIIIAYEPVWAIGTGRTAEPSDASEMHEHVRNLLEKHFGEGAGIIPILYGGSVKPENASDLLGSRHVDGLLVGGASLDPASFAEICVAEA